jgi:ribonucleotide reductase beta subunit family protein with ferritin-like domain
MKEPLLDPTEDRLVLFPLKYEDMWEKYKEHMAVFWTVEEIDLTQDITDWQNLSPEEQHFISHVLAFFSSSDAIVNENLAQRFYNDVQIPEARAFYSFQIAMETIHSEMYGIMIDTYIKDAQEKDRLFNAIKHLPYVEKKARWAQKWINDRSAPYSQRIIAFVAVEGIFFSGSFCSLYWLKKRGLMPGLTLSNEFIARDEGLHCEFAALMHKHLNNKANQTQIIQIISEATEIEKEFVQSALPVSLIGMNNKLMVQYIEFVADFWLMRFGVNPIYNSENPFEWMDMISMEGKTNFFEKRVSEYQRPGILSGQQENTFTLNADF